MPPAGVVVRTATTADVPALAALRWQWAMPGRAAEPGALQDFGAMIEQWMIRRREASVGKLAILDGEVVGMAWLAVLDRMPNPDHPNRRSGDLQSVFVLPEHRGLGLGRRLVEAICEAADDLGIRKLTVDSDEGAVPFYQQLGFARSDLLLQRKGPRAPTPRE